MFHVYKTYTDSPVSVLDFCNTDIAFFLSRPMDGDGDGGGNVWSVRDNKFSIMSKPLNDAIALFWSQLMCDGVDKVLPECDDNFSTVPKSLNDEFVLELILDAGESISMFSFAKFSASQCLLRGIGTYFNLNISYWMNTIYGRFIILTGRFFVYIQEINLHAIFFQWMSNWCVPSAHALKTIIQSLWAPNWYADNFGQKYGVKIESNKRAMFK